jgi:Spy/CpxP family protein refolding chaperone
MARIPRWLVVMVALVLVVGMLATAQAQPPDRGPGRPGGGFRVGITQLLQNEAIQRELKLGEEQINQLKDIRDEMRKSEGRPTPEKLAEIEKQVKDVLEPEQLKRLEEIRLQLDLRMQGVRALSEGALAEKLGITDEQKAKLNKIGEESRAKIGEAFPRPEGGDRPQLTDEQRAARMTKMQELRKEAYEQAIKVLTPEQKEKLDGMTGKEFKIDMQGMMGGMRGPGRGDRGQGRQRGQNQQNQ